MGTALFLIYVILLLVQVIFLFRNIKKPLLARWKLLYTSELISLTVAVAVAFYYNSLPDPGFLGMTYFAEILFSMVAASLFAVMLAVSLLLSLISKFKNRK